MTGRTSRRLFLLIPLLILVAGCISSSVVSTADPASMGTLEGTARYVSANCPSGQPGYTIPPCSGPYVGYQFEILNAESQDVVSTVVTDADAFFRVPIPVGEYIIRTQAGATPDVTRDNRFSIDSGKLTTMELVVGTNLQ